MAYSNAGMVFSGQMARAPRCPWTCMGAAIVIPTPRSKITRAVFTFAWNNRELVTYERYHPAGFHAWGCTGGHDGAGVRACGRAAQASHAVPVLQAPAADALRRTGANREATGFRGRRSYGAA